MVSSESRFTNEQLVDRLAAVTDILEQHGRDLEDRSLRVLEADVHRVYAELLERGYSRFELSKYIAVTRP